MVNNPRKHIVLADSTNRKGGKFLKTPINTDPLHKFCNVTLNISSAIIDLFNE